MRLLGLIVDLVNEDILESDPLPLPGPVVGTGLHQGMEIILPVDWHNALADIIGRPVKRNCQTQLQRLVS